MRTLYKAVILVTMLSMLVVPLTACTQKSTEPVLSAAASSAVAATSSAPQDQLPRPVGYDVKKELAAYTDTMVLTGYYNYGTKVDPNNFFHDWVLQNFKIDLQNTYVTGENYDDKVRTLSAANQLPDVLMTWGRPLFDEMATNQQLLPLDDLLTNYAPDSEAWYAKPIRDMMRASDGKLYTLVGYNLPIGNEEYRKIYYGGIPWGQVFTANETMLAATNMQTPKTIDDMVAFLKAAAALPGVNGKKVIPFELYGFGPADYTNTGYPGGGSKTILMHLLEQTPTSDFNIPDDANMMMKFAYDHPAYLKFLKLMNMLFRENLIDKEIFISTVDQLDAKMKEGRTAMCAFANNIEAINTTLSGDKTASPYAPVNYPMDPSVTKPNVIGISPVGGWYWAINKNVKEPERLAKYIDWHYTDEGLMFDNYGPPDSTKARNTWWYESGTAPAGMKLEGKPVLDLALQQKWDKEQAGWEGEKCGSWGVNALGLRMSMNYAKPVEFGQNMASDFVIKMYDATKGDQEVFFYDDLSMVKFASAPFGEIFKQKGTNVNDLLNKWEVKIIMDAKSDADVDSMFAQMMKEARAAGYDDIAKEAYQVYLKANGK